MFLRRFRPMMRIEKVVLVVVVIVVLLAGAGVVGIAVGFGAQTLVKDFLTGLFLISTVFQYGFGNRERSFRMRLGAFTPIGFVVACVSGVPVIASLFDRRAAGLYHNTAAYMPPDGTLCVIFRMIHFPVDPLYYEKFYFTPGDLGYKAFDTPVGRVGTLVCWDQWYPEGARITALQGATVLFYPTAIGWHPAEKEEFGTAQYEAWQTIQRAHAIANGVYVAAVNRVGHEHGDVRGNRAEGPGLEFWGGSFLADPFGRVVAKASHDKEEILIGEIDMHLLEETRRNWPFLRDRRIDSYEPIVHRFLDGGE